MLNFVLTCAAVPIQLTHGSLWKIPPCIGGILKIFIFLRGKTYVFTYHEKVKSLKHNDIILRSFFDQIWGQNVTIFWDMTIKVAHLASTHFPRIKRSFSVSYLPKADYLPILPTLPTWYLPTKSKSHRIQIYVNVCI